MSALTTARVPEGHAESGRTNGTRKNRSLAATSTPISAASGRPSGLGSSPEEDEAIRVLIAQAPPGVSTDQGQQSGLLPSIGHHDRHAPPRQSRLPSLAALGDLQLLVPHRWR